MAKKIRIKDIADMAGVSGGTVDRVLHNRGNISPTAKERVEKALEQLGYEPNIHVSAISIKKKYRIVITTPQFLPGEYWSLIYNGVVRAVREFGSLDIECSFFPYDQYDLYSCRETFDCVSRQACDAVIIGATFREQTRELAASLDQRLIPYVFVDSMVEGTDPLAFFSSDHYTCGYLVAKLITGICPEGSLQALFQAVRMGDESANTTILRKKGFMDYCREKGIDDNVIGVSFSVSDPEKNDHLIGEVFNREPGIKGATVLSSRGNIISDYLDGRGVQGVKIVCIDLTDRNIEALKEGRIAFVIGQRPGQQGFMAVKALIQYLVYGQSRKKENYLPLDILTKENVDYYSEFPEEGPAA